MALTRMVIRGAHKADLDADTEKQLLRAIGRHFDFHKSIGFKQFRCAMVVPVRWRSGSALPVVHN